MTKRLGDIQMHTLDTQILRKAIVRSRQFEQMKIRCCSPRFFWYAFHRALQRVDLVNLRFEEVRDRRIVSPICKTDT